MSIFFFAIFAIYIMLGLLYMLQSPISKLVACLLGRSSRRNTTSVSPPTPAQNPNYSRIFSCCRQMIFTTRLSVFNCTHHCCGDGAIHRPTLDERKFQSWTVSQVAQWAYSQLQTQNSFSDIHSHQVVYEGAFENTDNVSEHKYNQQRAVQTAIAILKRQHIDGRSLAYLTLDRLIDFGVAFGVAVNFMACLDELIPDRFVSDEEKAGGELPSWYEISHEVVAKVDNESSVEVEEQEMAMAEKAQNLMKDRFGITLPTLRGQDVSSNGDVDAQANSLCTQKPPEKLPQFHSLNENNKHYQGEDGDHSNRKSPLNDETVRSPSLPTGQLEEILNSMPAHVRAVAEHNPDLASKLLSKKMQQPQRSQFQQHHRQMEASLHTVSEEAYHSEEEFNIDPESVSLLRRRTNNR
mmetsp:Transcript_7616/g.17237  ORF Transcript_7616/g.17237 Transcript_7616/m.17237 type:complete len:408 (+) Transcript_7616:57-1280(+)